MNPVRTQPKAGSSTRRQSTSKSGSGKPRGGKGRKSAARPGYQITVRGKAPADLSEKVSLLHAKAILEAQFRLEAGRRILES